MEVYLLDICGVSGLPHAKLQVREECENIKDKKSPQARSATIVFGVRMVAFLGQHQIYIVALSCATYASGHQSDVCIPQPSIFEVVTKTILQSR